MTDINIPLLRKVVEWVEEQETLEASKREWRQAMWMTKSWCGTQACVAGKIALLEGWEPLFASRNDDATGNVIKDGVEASVSDVAIKALGVSHDEIYPLSEDAHCPACASGLTGLFAASNTAADVRREAEALAGEPL